MRVLRTAAVSLLLASCSTTTNQDHMLAHYERTEELTGAIVYGDLEAARPPARWLAEHDQMDLPPTSVVALEDFRSAAREVYEAQDMDAAAAATARTAKACGTCHLELGGPQLAVADDAPTERDLTSHMTRHSWAVNQMWNGLAGPSEESWQAGASALTDEPLDAWTLEAPLEGAEHARDLADRVHRMTARLDTASGWATRTTAFGVLLATCADCHEGRF